MARSREPGSIMSPRAISTPAAARRPAFELGRARARTCLPRASSASTTWPPSAPVPPTTSTGPSFMVVSSRVGRGLVHGALNAHLAVVAERGPPEVEAPGDARGDAHVRGRTELAGAFDQFGGAVDAQVARGPRIDRGQVVDDECDLLVARRHVAELTRLDRV